jgi:hypothetical protein
MVKALRVGSRVEGKSKHCLNFLGRITHIESAGNKQKYRVSWDTGNEGLYFSRSLATDLEIRASPPPARRAAAAAEHLDADAVHPMDVYESSTDSNSNSESSDSENENEVR